MEKKKEESKFKSIATENNNINVSIDSRMATERSKTPNKREVNYLEDKSDVIQFPPKKLPQVMNIESQHIHNYANKIDQSDYAKNEDKNKRVNTSRSKSQMPAKVIIIY